MPSWSNTIRGKSVESLLRSIKKGFEADFDEREKMMWRGEMLSRSELVSMMDAALEPYIQARQLLLQARAMVNTRNKREPATRKMLLALLDVIPNRTGLDTVRLWKYGIRLPKKRRKLTVREKLVQVAKAKATRKLRGTKGKRQRETLKARGEPTVTVVEDDAGTKH